MTSKAPMLNSRLHSNVTRPARITWTRCHFTHPGWRVSWWSFSFWGNPEFHRYHLDISVIFTTKLMATVCIRRTKDYGSPVGCVWNYSSTLLHDLLDILSGDLWTTFQRLMLKTLAEAAVKPFTVWKNTFQILVDTFFSHRKWNIEFPFVPNGLRTHLLAACSLLICQSLIENTVWGKALIGRLLRLSCFVYFFLGKLTEICLLLSYFVCVQTVNSEISFLRDWDMRNVTSSLGKIITTATQ